MSGLILRRIFDRNQEEFTKAEPKTIPTIAVVEEAQAVLNEKSSASGPYVEWVKEGRKYDLGALLITQQPGSIPVEILSQGDNWFIFHLLSAADLRNVKSANAHFSDDLLSTLLNEPIPGQGIFWSSAGNTIYPIPIRVLSFEKLYDLRDPEYRLPSINVYANELRKRYSDYILSQSEELSPTDTTSDFAAPATEEEIEEGEGLDVFAMHKRRAIDALQKNQEFTTGIEQSGIPWGVVKGMLAEELPATLDDRDNIAFNLVTEALNQILGQGNWETERRGHKNTTFIFKS